MTPLLLSAALLQPAPMVDALGDPLPPGALLRIGTTRLRPGGMVTSMAFTPDGKRLVTANTRTGVHVWDAATGKELHHLPNADDSVEIVALFPDASRFATLKQGGSWVLRTVADGAELGTVPASGGRFALTFTADGKSFAETARDQVVLGEIAGKQGMRRAALPSEFPQVPGPVALSPSDNTVAVPQLHHPLSLYDFATGKLLRTFDQPQDGVGYRAVAFAPDGKQVAGVRQSHRAVDIWDVATGKCGRTLEGAFFAPEVLAFTADGRWLLTCGKEPPVRVWDLATGKELRALPAEYGGVSTVAVSPDGKTVATAAGTAVQLWDVTTGKELAVAVDRLYGTAHFQFSGDGKRLISQRTTGKTPDYITAFHVWDAATGKHLEKIDWGQEATRAVLSGDGRLLAVVKGYTGVEVCERAGGKCVFKLAPAAGIVDFMDLSPDGTRLALSLRELVGTEEGRSLMQLWDVAAGKLLMELEEPPRQVCHGIFSDNGRALQLTRGRPDRLRVECYSATSGRKLRRPGLAMAEEHLEYATVGGRLAARLQYLSDSVSLHELATGTIARFPLPGRRMHLAAFSPNGRLLAASTMEGLIVTWDLAIGREVARLNGHRGDVYWLSWSPDGKRLVSYGEETTAVVWDAAPWYAAANGQWTAPQLAALWEDLASADGERGFAAVGKLVLAGGPAVAFLKQQLRPATAADVARIEALVADLGDVKFAVRQAAQTELAKLGELAVPALEKALASKPTLEVRQRIEGLFVKMETPPTVPGALRPQRAVLALTWIGTPEARAVLEGLAAGDDGAWLTQVARAALGRLPRNQE
jgi:WD40 repeat protein